MAGPGRVRMREGVSRRVRRIVAAGVWVVGLWRPAVVPGQEAAPSQPGAVVGQTEAPHSWTTEQLVTSTVHEAWVLSGRNEDQFFAMVKELAAMSAQKRGLTLPATQTAGAKAGQLIKQEAKRDPDQLLYAVVERAVVKTGTKTAASLGQ